MCLLLYCFCVELLLKWSKLKPYSFNFVNVMMLNTIKEKFL